MQGSTLSGKSQSLTSGSTIAPESCVGRLPSTVYSCSLHECRSRVVDLTLGASDALLKTLGPEFQAERGRGKWGVGCRKRESPKFPISPLGQDFCHIFTVAGRALLSGTHPPKFLIYGAIYTFLLYSHCSPLFFLTVPCNL